MAQNRLFYRIYYFGLHEDQSGARMDPMLADVLSYLDKEKIPRYVSEIEISEIPRPYGLF